MTSDSAPRMAGHADALIVGSALKYDGDWRQPVEISRVTRMRAALDAVEGWS